MKSKIISLAAAAMMSLTAMAQTSKPSSIWIHYEDRFCAPDSLPLANIDSVEFTTSSMKRFKYNETTGSTLSLSKAYNKKEANYYDFSFARYLAKPSEYNSCDYTKETSQWCLQRSAESEHFICFWEKGATRSGNTIRFKNSTSTVNVKTLLDNAENIWKVYVEQLGFLEPGKSVTDKTKIHMYLKDQYDWRADGSGQGGTSFYYEGTTKKSRSTSVGLFHCNPDAATARGGHTPAHEIGHVFQYLVSADLGQTHGFNYGFGPNASGGNEWWEDCANWQAYKVYPGRQFTDGEYFEGYMLRHHLNIHNEASRYHNCFYHDWWCMKHGKNTIGRIWRESKKPEDPTEAYMRIFGLDVESFADEQFEGYMRFTSIDIDGVREQGKVKIGAEPQHLIEPSDAILNNYLGGDKDYWIIAPDYCPENFGYNASPLKVPAAGTVVTANFKGIVGAPGYRAINKQYAGWRYGIAAYCSDGTRVYSEIGKGAEGKVSITVPEKCQHMWFVAMGAPTQYWRHPWDEDVTNDEQWPYAVKIEGTSPKDVRRTYGEFPEDYVRKDTTVVINATLPYSATDYGYVYVQYDRDAICEALGISSDQLWAVKRNDNTSNPGDVRFAGVNADGKTFTFNTTTSTSYDICYGHWFTTAGNVCGYDSSAAIYAETFTYLFNCKLGQYPGRLTRGKTYVIRQAFVYTHTDGKKYTATMETHVTVQ